jgi:CubicO group peptidase (beta-lactamase class C family)
MIEDWEVGTLYLNCLRNANGDEGKALEKVRGKYWDEFMTRDIFFFLGTRKSDHHMAPNPFSIVGVFYPPVDKQGKLF